MMLIPELFVCPISLDIMSDPVTLSTTARTYDRPNIRRWLAAGHRTCPVTMRRLPKSGSKEVLLVPNRTLKHLIDRWILTGRTLSISDLALPTLKDNLLAGMDDTTVMEETLRIVMLLSPPGFCALLLRLLLRHSRHDDDDDRAPAHALLVELALDCLLASPSAHELAASLQTGDVSSFAVVLRRGSLTVRTGLCRLMHIAADTMAEQQLCIMVLGRSEKVMGALAALVHDGGAASDAALRAMSSLCSSDQAIRETAVAAGAVDALLSYISYGAGHCRKWPPCSALLSRALETLEQVLVSVGSGRQAMYARYGATAVLVKMVFRVPFDQGSGSSDHAIGSLLVACRESAEVRVDAINAGLLTQLLLLLQSQRASPRAKANALALLKLLRTIWARH
ncbi:U-box domain-containing protein 26-like [Lolium perenne]|uniref:U-box domain-containing protein 26-like n=1 Tax=Lolium perenne TaxID=4522 RepID=UPI0021F68CBF|nr:U-box domain-containing protein 26-like [Lolium perenne]